MRENNARILVACADSDVNLVLRLTIDLRYSESGVPSIHDIPFFFTLIQLKNSQLNLNYIEYCLEFPMNLTLLSRRKIQIDIIELRIHY